MSRAAPATRGISCGRNVPTAAIEKTHAFGFSHWNVAACRRLNGCETSARPTPPAPEDQDGHVEQVRRADHLEHDLGGGHARRAGRRCRPRRRAPAPPSRSPSPGRAGASGRTRTASPMPTARRCSDRARRCRRTRSPRTPRARSRRTIQAAGRQEVLYDLHVVTTPGEWVRAWRPAVPGIHEVFHARFVDHAYPPHTHDTWTVFIVDEGAIRYDLEARHRGAAGARVTILPPHVVHDGRRGHRRRVPQARALPRHRGPRRTADRPSRRRSRHRGHGPRSRAPRAPPLAGGPRPRRSRPSPRSPSSARGSGGTSASGAAERRAARPRGRVRPSRPARRRTAFERLTLAEAGRILHVSPAHLVRSFSRTFGIAPHRYVLGTSDRRRAPAAARRRAGRAGGGRRRLPRPGAPHPALPAPRRHDAGAVRGDVRHGGPLAPIAPPGKTAMHWMRR